MLTLLAVAALQVASPPPPPVYRPHLVDFDATTAQCGGRSIAPLSTVAPFTQIARVAGNPPRAIEMRFTLGADGRPLGITQRPVEGGHFSFVVTTDLAPALSLWRFPADAAGASCAMTFTPRTVPLDRAADSDLYRVAALRMTSGDLHRDLMKRIREAGDCAGPGRARPLLRAFIDNRRIPQRSGVPSHAVIAYDVDAEGVPQNPTIVSSDGNQVLEAAARDAAARGRYVGNAPRTRCTMPYVRRAFEPVPAPPMPPKQDVAIGSTCREAVRWAQPPALDFPDAFRRRAIEGWAIVRYDVAPWGATGAVTVLASEPAIGFGEQARRMIAGARAQTSSSGAQGCVSRVVFRMPAVENPDDESADF